MSFSVIAWATPFLGVALGDLSLKAFPRGEGGTKIGNSEPIFVTDEECGRKPGIR